MFYQSCSFNTSLQGVYRPCRGPNDISTVIHKQTQGEKVSHTDGFAITSWVKGYIKAVSVTSFPVQCVL